MPRAADVDCRGALRVVLGAVDVRPGRRVEDEAGLDRRRRQRHVPVGVGERDDLILRERLLQRAPELAARSRDYDALSDVLSRSERIGDWTLQRWATRGSFQGMPCSSGSAPSYSSLTR
jgi:hypothetical protein